MSVKNLPTGAYPVLRWFRERPRAIAVRESNVSFSYADLARNIAQAVKALAAAGVGPKMLVGIECEPRYLSLILILACEVLGAAHVALVASDLSVDSDLIPRCDVLCLQTVEGGAALAGCVVRLSPDFARSTFEAPVEDADYEGLGRTWPEDDLVRVFRTSGTTGQHKFGGNTRKTLRNIIDILPYLLKFDATRHSFISLYTFHQMGTYSDSILALESGGIIVYGALENFADSIRSLPASHSSLLVRSAVALLTSDQFRDGPLDSCTIRVIGGSMPAELRAALRKTITPHVCVTYSMNETSYITTDDHDGTDTIVPDISVKIVDDDGHDVRPGEAGRILASTPRMGDGYLWNEAETRKYFIDGWFWTSDIGVMPQPGKLTVLGRIDDMINLGGVKLAPAPVEERIRAVDGVSDAILVGKDTQFGTCELHVFVERDDAALDRALEALAARLLGSYGVSFQIHFVSELPRTDTGKARRNLLRDSLARA